MKNERNFEKSIRDHEEISIAYLYGSTAKDTIHKDSDIDIGLLLNKEFESDPLYTVKIAREIEKEVGSDREVDVRILNDKPITFQHQVLKNGRRIFSRDEKTRIKFETRVYDRYLDYKPFFEQYNKIRRKRLIA